MTDSTTPTIPNTAEQLAEENWILYLMENKLWDILYADTTDEEIDESDSVPIVDPRVTRVEEL